MTRRASAATAMLLLAGLILTDLLVTRPNPYQAPSIVAIGSGTVSTGGFCGALPD